MQSIRALSFIATMLLTASFIIHPTCATAPLTIGQPAPEFALKDLRGQTHALKSYRGKITVIAFLAATCPISNIYNERIRTLAEEFGKQNVVWLGVNSDRTESVGDIRAHAEKNRLAFTILKDEGNKIADAYGAVRTPEIFVLDAAGALRYHGRIDNSPEVRQVKRQDLREALNELLAGKPVSVPEAKALGCVIKRVQDEGKAKRAVSFNEDRPAENQSTWFNSFGNSFVPQKRPVAKRPAASKAAKTAFTPNVSLLKPAEFPKLRDSLKGQVIVLNFWATWCGPCVVEFPEFVKLDSQYRDKGVKIIAISADDSTDLQSKVVPFIKQQRASFPVYVQDTDDPQEMIDLINKDWQGTLPATFIYDKQGKLVLSRFGIIDREQLVAAIEKALK